MELDSEWLEIRVEGELDLSVADRLRKRLDAVALADVDVLVCLERCDFIDSTGIAAIVSARNLIERSGRRLFICGPSGQVARILAMTGLDHVGLVYDSTDAARAARRRP